jgi:hypothetical protein
MNSVLPVTYVILEERDQQLLQIENVIEFKRKMLLEKQKKLKHISKQNQFLEHIKDDYNNYYSYIIQQKREQMEALDLLNKYIHDLTISGKLSKHNIKDAKYEQRKIVSELNTIKQNLDNIIKDTNNIATTIKEKRIS